MRREAGRIHRLPIPIRPAHRSAMRRNLLTGRLKHRLCPTQTTRLITRQILLKILERSQTKLLISIIIHNNNTTINSSSNSSSIIIPNNSIMLHNSSIIIRNNNTIINSNTWNSRNPITIHNNKYMWHSNITLRRHNILRIRESQKNINI